MSESLGICDPSFWRDKNAKHIIKNIEKLKIVSDRLKAAIVEIKCRVDEAQRMPQQHALSVPRPALEWLH